MSSATARTGGLSQRDNNNGALARPVQEAPTPLGQIFMFSRSLPNRHARAASGRGEVRSAQSSDNPPMKQRNSARQRISLLSKSSTAMNSPDIKRQGFISCE
jgi:hypothetical protein